MFVSYPEICELLYHARAYYDSTHFGYAPKERTELHSKRAPPSMLKGSRPLWILNLESDFRETESPGVLCVCVCVCVCVCI